MPTSKEHGRESHGENPAPDRRPAELACRVKDPGIRIRNGEVVCSHRCIQQVLVVLSLMMVLFMLMIVVCTAITKSPQIGIAAVGLVSVLGGGLVYACVWVFKQKLLQIASSPMQDI